MDEDKNIVYFDGVCGFCNSSVDFAIRQDKNNKLLFTPLQGETAAKNLGILSGEQLTTVIFQTKGKLYQKSEAGIRILYTIGGLWRFMIILLIFPAFIRDFFYDFISRNRYKWFGKKEACRIPAKEERLKFLS